MIVQYKTSGSDVLQTQVVLFEVVLPAGQSKFFHGDFFTQSPRVLLTENILRQMISQGEDNFVTIQRCTEGHYDIWFNVESSDKGSTTYCLNEKYVDNYNEYAEARRILVYLTKRILEEQGLVKQRATILHHWAKSISLPEDLAYLTAEYIDPKMPAFKVEPSMQEFVNLNRTQL